MESFSASVKSYIAKRSLEEMGIGEKERAKWKDCCGKAFLRAVFQNLAPDEIGDVILSSSFPELLEIVTFLMIRLFDTEGEPLHKNPKGYRGGSVRFPSHGVNRVLGETAPVTAEGCDRCRVLYIRASFLLCGTVLNPEKGYHAAFSPFKGKGAEELTELLNFYGVEPSLREKEGKLTVYFKESAKIEDLLSVIGAQHFSLSLMNQRVEKSIRANINRRQNFDGANLKKTVNGAQSTILAIHYLEKNGILEGLSEPLQKAAKLRLSYPEVSLAELCERSEDEITKSGLNHRLQKLCTLAEKHRKKELGFEE